MSVATSKAAEDVQDTALTHMFNIRLNQTRFHSEVPLQVKS